MRSAKPGNHLKQFRHVSQYSFFVIEFDQFHNCPTERWKFNPSADFLAESGTRLFGTNYFLRRARLFKPTNYFEFLWRARLFRAAYRLWRARLFSGIKYSFWKWCRLILMFRCGELHMLFRWDLDTCDVHIRGWRAGHNSTTTSPSNGTFVSSCPN